MESAVLGRSYIGLGLSLGLGLSETIVYFDVLRVSSLKLISFEKMCPFFRTLVPAHGIF